MAPAFGLVEAKALLPCFTGVATEARKLHLHSVSRADSGPHRQMADKWNRIIESSKSGDSAVIDVTMWLGKATLDAYVLASGSASGGCRPRVNRELISRKDRRWSLRVRFWGSGRSR